MKDDLDVLRVNPGDEITAVHHNLMVDAIGRRRLVGGPGVLVSQFDDHQLVRYTAPPAASVSTAWSPSLISAGSGDANPTGALAGVTFGQGLVNGIEPQIEGKNISDPACPPLLIQSYDQQFGDCLIYLQATLNISSHLISSATMIASATVPAWQAWTALKLIAVANQNGQITPVTYFNQGFAASNVKSNGLFQSWWWAI